MPSQARIRRALARGRAMANARMTSTCAIRRDGGLGEQDPVTGIQPRIWEQIHVDLPCRLSGNPRGASTSRKLSPASGEVEVPVRYLSVAFDTAGIEDGDLVEITSGERAGLVLQIVESSGADQQTALRLPVIGARRPDEWIEVES